ncbi:MAG: Asp-tRNA(Asn)/Glu-tRNA(Gln) amidotransferase subunit GatC [Marinobacter sp.]|uniref:Asp-tRNA(Asn)/Glu-tRNA(Gln) amidotransferase subunit GatC n=1 Tax=Marinobacter sp. TaxID=50741 RepID=UPI003C519859
MRVDEEQVSALEKDLGNILDLVDQLAAADTANVEPLAHPLDAVQRLRADEVTETDQREAFQAIAPATENGLYLVPRVIE